MAITLTVDRTPLRDHIVTTSRLVLIEFRRGFGLFAFPILVLIALCAARASYDRNDTNLFWIGTSLSVAYTAMPMTWVVSALAAWDGGREGRRQMGDLLGTMPGHVFQRDLSCWAGTALWSLLAYGMFACIELVPVALRASWGGPRWDALLFGVVTNLTASSIGYAAGAALPSRFIPPVVALLTYVLVVLVGVGKDGTWMYEFRYLSPYNTLGFYPADVGVFQAFDSSLVGQSTVWLAALGVTALAVVGLVRSRTPRMIGVLAITVAVAILAATPLVPASDIEWRDGESRAINVVLTCATNSVDICVHPVFAPVLPGYAGSLGAMLAPLVGLPGGPVRAVSTGAETSRLASGGTLDFAIPIASPDPDQVALTAIAQALVSHGTQRLDMEAGNCYWFRTDAQHVVLQALLRRAMPSPDRVTPLGESGAGGTYYCDPASMRDGRGEEIPVSPEFLARQAETDAAIDRFSALPLDQQRAWFATHLLTLRAGELTLADLP